MTIASEITRIKTNISNAYDALEEKGATIPSDKNSANLVDTINTITGGETNHLGRIITEDGTFTYPSENFSFSLPKNATSIGKDALYYAFTSCTTLTSVDFSSVISISENALNSAFQDCTGLISVDLSSVTNIGEGGLQYAFAGCTSLTSVDLSSVTSISENCFLVAFANCTNLTSLSFSSLNSNSFGSYTSQFTFMLSQVPSCTVHFPSNLESVIGDWSDVTSGFGGTDTTVLFDLPATT